MNIFSTINKSSGSNYNKIQPTTEELIDRAFAPKNNKIDILFINPPSSISKRYGKEDMGEVGGDLIPLGIASLAAYIREKGYGVGVLDCPTLRIDNEKVYEIILDVLKKSSILRAERRYMGIREEPMQEAAKRALRTYLVNKTVPKNTVPQVYTFLSIYADAEELAKEGKTPRSPQWRNLFNAILNEIEELIVQTRVQEDEETSADAIRTHLHTPANKGGGLPVFWSAAGALEDDLTYYVNKKQVIPLTYGMPKDRPLGGSGPGVQGAFPEIEGILNAMKHLQQMGFSPRDMHTENIMMRPDTNQLVMTDVGLFLVTKG